VYRLADARSEAERSGAGRRDAVPRDVAFARSLFPFTYALDEPAKGGDLLQLLIHRSLADILLRREPCHCNNSAARERVLSSSLSLLHHSLYFSRADPSILAIADRRIGIRSDRRFTLPFVFIRTLDYLPSPPRPLRPSPCHLVTA